MVVAGPFDMTANALFLLASRTGDLSVVAPLASLYPVTTVILALIVDRERLRAVQVLGLALAVAGPAAGLRLISSLRRRWAWSDRASGPTRILTAAVAPRRRPRTRR